MTIRIACRVLMVAVVAIGSTAARAEDIDIYSQNRNITPGAPNVLLVLDNRGSTHASFSGYNSKFDATLASLATVVNALKAQFNLGIAFYTETNPLNSATQPKGGYIRFAIQPMTDSGGGATPQRNCLLYMTGSSGATCSASNTSYTVLSLANDAGDAGQTSLIMDEAYDYFKGINAYAGAHIYKADKEAFVSGVNTGPQYKSPSADGTCTKNFIIFINNDNINDAAGVAATAMTHLGAAGGETSIINFGLGDTTSSNVASDEWARFLNKSDLQVVTYTLEVGPSTTGQGPYTTALLQSMGRQGKGGYYTAIDAATLTAALARIFNDIQAKNSVFASSSLPLSADNTGNFANQVYMSVFRPDGSGLPRWLGNLKQYKFKPDNTNQLFLADADGNPAASGTTGFAQSSARSFWTSIDTNSAPDAPLATATDATTGSTGGFWWFDSKGDGGPYDSPDGNWVEKGGAAQQLRLAYLGYGGKGGIGDLNTSMLNSVTANARKVYTCTGSCLATGAALSTTPFDSSNTAITSDPSQFGINPASSVTVTSITSGRAVTTISAGTTLPGVVSTLKTDNVTGTLVTVTMSKNHNLPNGTSYVTIANSSISGTNGTFLVTNTGNKTFTYAVPAAALNTTSSTTPTATTASQTALVTFSVAHGFSNGATVTIAGASCTVGSFDPCAAFNGSTFTASNKQTLTFNISLASPVGATANTGAITASSNVARVTTSAANGFSTNDSVTVSSATCASSCTGYNTTAAVSLIVSSTTFDYPYSGSPLPDASSATLVNNTGASAALATLLKWVRGQDTQDENGFKVAGADTDVRASIHGDILHSRPVVMNYADTGATTDNVYLFYGGNDGVFRAIKGGQAATDGKEQWAFIPKEFFPILKRQYDNSPAVLYPSTPAGVGATRRDYAWDGPVASYVERNDSGVVQKVYLYLSARRGGRFIYALDVTSPTNPKFLWRKGCTTSGGTTTCDSGFSELAQTWSAPSVVKVQGHTHPVLIFGGGYDAASEDPEPPLTADTMGRMIYVVDAFDGSIVWTAGNAAANPTVSVTGMNFSIPADILTVDRDQIGYVDRAYVADIGGNIWRVDLGGSDTSTWAVWKIASVGNRTSSSAGRKFMFGPDVVLGDKGTFDAVVIGSGDREHPLISNAGTGITNRAYMFMDTNTGTAGSDLNITETDLAQVSVTDSSATVDLTNKKGWFMTLRPAVTNVAGGEQVVNGPIVVASQMIFGTNQACASGKTDDNGECLSSGGELTCTGNLGIARRYDINYLTTGPTGYTDSSGSDVRWQVAIGGGFLPTPVAGVVEVNGSNYPFIIDNPLNPGGVINPTIDVKNFRYRTYWHELLE